MPRPAMSGADPWTGSNRLGCVRSRSMFALGAMPIVPVELVTALEEQSGYRELFRALERPSSAAAVTVPVRGTAR